MSPGAPKPAKYRPPEPTPIEWNDFSLSAVMPSFENYFLHGLGPEPYLSYGERLVRIAPRKPKSQQDMAVEGCGRANAIAAPLGLEIQPVTEARLRLDIGEHFTFYRILKGGDRKPLPVPLLVVKTMLEESHRNAPPLVSLIDHPYVDDDGAVPWRDGYDEKTGIYLSFDVDLLPRFEDEVTQEDAAESYQWLVEVLFADFPFSTEEDAAGAVALLLTMMQRKMILGEEGCPAFAVVSPSQSSGKTTLVRLCAMAIYGRLYPVASFPKDEAEMQKKLLSILMVGDPLVLLDNVPHGGQLESESLAVATTGSTYRGRLLGHSRVVDVPSNAVICFTGNNIQPIGDFVTRTLSVYLDAQSSEPDKRNFERKDPIEWCRANREKILHHIFVILCGYRRMLKAAEVVDNRPFEPTRFTHWDEQIRKPLLWAGASDPASLLERNRQNDTDTDDWLIFLSTWFEKCGSRPVQLKVLLDAGLHMGMQDVDLRMLDAVRAVLNDDKVDTRRLSTECRKRVNQWVGGYCLQKEPQSALSKSSAKWKVVRDDVDNTKPPISFL